MSPAWMPFYVGDFTVDTMHLGATETGIYIRLIIHCWQHGTIPRDDRRLALIGHCDTRLWHQYKETVLQFFDVVDASTMHHKRVSTELHRCQELSNKRKANALQQHRKSSATAVQVHTQSQSQLQSKKEKEDSCAVAKATRNECFEEFWKVYPRRDGANPRAPAEKLFLAAVKAGSDPKEIIEGAKRCSQREAKNIGTPYIPQAVKWLRDKRWLDYNSDMLTPAFDIRAHLS